jgi:hypothetical protein
MLIYYYIGFNVKGCRLRSVGGEGDFCGAGINGDSDVEGVRSVAISQQGRTTGKETL